MKKLYCFVISVLVCSFAIAQESGIIAQDYLDKLIFEDGYDIHADFQIISSLEVGTTKITLEKKTFPKPKRKNGDGIYFYQTDLAVGFQTESDKSHIILDTQLFMEAGLINENLPCMMVEPTAQKIFVFASSKSPKKHGVDKNAMDGFLYTYDMQSGKWKKESVFKNKDWGWFSFFGGSNNGVPELWFYSKKKNQIVYFSKYNGSYYDLERGTYSLSSITKEYPYRRNILVANRPDVQPMANDNRPKMIYFNDDKPKTQTNIVNNNNSDSSLSTVAALAGAGLLAYGLFKLLSSGLSSTSTSYYSGGRSYTSSSSYSSSYSSSSPSSSSSNSSSTTSTSSSSSSTSKDSSKTYSCKVKIYYDGNMLTGCNIEAYFHRERFSQSGGWAKYWVDANGDCTITWLEERGDAIERISFSEFGRGYVIKDIMLKDGQTYVLTAKENL